MFLGHGQGNPAAVLRLSLHLGNPGKPDKGKNLHRIACQILVGVSGEDQIGAFLVDPYGHRSAGAAGIARRGHGPEDIVNRESGFGEGQGIAGDRLPVCPAVLGVFIMVNPAESIGTESQVHRTACPVSVISIGVNGGDGGRLLIHADLVVGDMPAFIACLIHSPDRDRAAVIIKQMHEGKSAGHRRYHSSAQLIINSLDAAGIIGLDFNVRKFVGGQVFTALGELFHSFAGIPQDVHRRRGNIIHALHGNGGFAQDLHMIDALVIGIQNTAVGFDCKTVPFLVTVGDGHRKGKLFSVFHGSAVHRNHTVSGLVLRDGHGIGSGRAFKHSRVLSRTRGCFRFRLPSGKGIDLLCVGGLLPAFMVGDFSLEAIGAVVNRTVPIHIPFDLVGQGVAVGFVAGIDTVAVDADFPVILQIHALLNFQGLAALHRQDLAFGNGEILIHRIAVSVDLAVAAFKDQAAPLFPVGLLRDGGGKNHRVSVCTGREGTSLADTGDVRICLDDAAGDGDGIDVFPRAAADTGRSVGIVIAAVTAAGCGNDAAGNQDIDIVTVSAAANPRSGRPPVGAGTAAACRDRAAGDGDVGAVRVIPATANAGTSTVSIGLNSAAMNGNCCITVSTSTNTGV